MICFLLLTAAPAAVMADYIRVKGTVVNVRQGPGTSHLVLFQAEQGEEFDLIRTEGLWCLIKLQRDQEAWVFRKLVDVIEGSRSGTASDVQAPDESGTSPTIWTRFGKPVFILFAILVILVGLLKRRKILQFTGVRLKEISGYKREQAFRYDNRKPSDDSWEI